MKNSDLRKSIPLNRTLRRQNSEIRPDRLHSGSLIPAEGYRFSLRSSSSTGCYVPAASIRSDPGFLVAHIALHNAPRSRRISKEPRLFVQCPLVEVRDVAFRCAAAQWPASCRRFREGPWSRSAAGNLVADGGIPGETWISRDLWGLANAKSLPSLTP